MGAVGTMHVDGLSCEPIGLDRDVDKDPPDFTPKKRNHRMIERCSQNKSGGSWIWTMQSLRINDSEP